MYDNQTKPVYVAVTDLLLRKVEVLDLTVLCDEGHLQAAVSAASNARRVPHLHRQQVVVHWEGGGAEERGRRLQYVYLRLLKLQHRLMSRSLLSVNVQM